MTKKKTLLTATIKKIKLGHKNESKSTRHLVYIDDVQFNKEILNEVADNRRVYNNNPNANKLKTLFHHYRNKKIKVVMID